MLKKTIKYTDYNGSERIEDFYFNLNQAEITKMELGVQGGLSEALKNIINSHDVPTLVEQFDKIVLSSVGRKSPDGKEFVKSPEISQAFKNTEAYSVLFMELISDAEAMAAFFNAIIPASALAEIEAHPEIKEQVKSELHLTEM